MRLSTEALEPELRLTSPALMTPSYLLDTWRRFSPTILKQLPGWQPSRSEAIARIVSVGGTDIRAKRIAGLRAVW